MSSQRLLIAAVTRMHAQHGRREPTDEFYKDWERIAWDDPESDSIKRLSGDIWDFWLVHGCNSLWPDGWDVTLLAEKLARGEWPTQQDMSKYASMALLFHGGEPASPEVVSGHCWVSGYTHLMTDQSPRLRVLYTLHAWRGLPTRLIKDLGSRLKLSANQERTLQLKLSEPYPQPTFRDVLHKLINTLPGLAIDLRSWEDHRDDASWRKLAKDWSSVRLGLGFKDMRGLVYQQASRELSWNPGETIEAFVRGDYRQIEAAEESWQLVRTLLPEVHPSDPPGTGTPSRLYWDAHGFLFGLAGPDGKAGFDSQLSAPGAEREDPYSLWSSAFFAALESLSKYYPVEEPSGTGA